MLSGNKFSSLDVLNEGFKPLKRMPTEPTTLTSSRPMSHGHRASFNAHTGEKEHIQFLWENSAWGRMERSKGKVLDKANTFVGPSPKVDSDKGAIAVVDPFSTGAHLAAQVAAAGYRVVKILSIWDSPVAALVEEGLVVEYCATLQFNDLNPNHEAALSEMMDSIKALPFEVLAVIPGAETGVELADQLSHRLGVRSNGEEGSMARRNKYLMGEKVREAGVRAVKQRLCRSLDEVRSFLQTLLPEGSTDLYAEGTCLKCVVKPVQSAGSDDVFLCNTAEEAEVAFTRISGKRNGLGLINDGALVQEFLSGKEYVIDKVSMDGVHKLVAIWQYDKRVCNGHNFVYFGMKLVSSDSPMAQAMVAYSSEVLDALGIVHGPSHMEVMWCGDHAKGYPCLVEVGSRCHGGEGTWIPVAQECVGFTQVSLTVDVYTTGEKFKQIKDGNRYPLTKAGRDVDMVSRHSGIVRGFPGEALIRSLPSFRNMHWECKVGDFISKTVDCFTRPGCVQLVNESEEQADRDLEAIHDWEELRMIDYSLICPNPPTVGAVVIVDPFSTGANLAAMAASMGYRIILVFSEIDSPVAALVAEGTNLKPMLLVQHNSKDRDQDRAIKETLAAIDSQEGAIGGKSPVLAILPGAETGVELAEKLATRYGTRGNGEMYTHLRRSKFSMQNAVRDAGLRAVTQALCRSEEDVRLFWASLVAAAGGGEAKCVVKPNESAGTDSVYLCQSLVETLTAFNSIHGQFNGLGQINDGALCQEYLLGTEFVIDGVSRDGVYKVTAVWEYDKRSANGANFVYFGMRLRSACGERERALVAYAEQVIQALHIVQGASHMEVIMTSTGPCLVEVGSRCHGGEASWAVVAEECVGYTQIEATLNCYLRPDRFDALPPAPETLLKQGAEVFMVSRQRGILTATPGLAEIRSMASFRRLGMLTQVGSPMVPTVDCFTRPGSVELVNALPADLEADCARIRQMELSEELFVVK
mmetsp:Transcript_8797/g.13163  ORF Transcript_8797/g.13163 Transcript_8797/m.13163 type:complete len:979 (-) Transcript_8797:119-3055(-)|eukprot:CAMPEP_0185024978 /NCGR_PEP_ID=MMETSP1103-20130426/8114_1 /TAXON_ID=36769 /ORGANISM="Paraphysomonas bandaiensis, Strain Caron Lab Isolate" /LENGTH=978 /DNA_ID=CAMNT_0027558081 /DNA_START=78 /DNA_END=3014 /DNA_ORIENTATION=+